MRAKIITTHGGGLIFNTPILTLPLTICFPKNFYTPSYLMLVEEKRKKQRWKLEWCMLLSVSGFFLSIITWDLYSATKCTAMIKYLGFWNLSLYYHLFINQVVDSKVVSLNFQIIILLFQDSLAKGYCSLTIFLHLL